DGTYYPRLASYTATVNDWVDVLETLGGCIVLGKHQLDLNLPPLSSGAITSSGLVTGAGFADTRGASGGSNNPFVFFRQTGSGNPNTITISSIPAGFDVLQIDFVAKSTNTG